MAGSRSDSWDGTGSEQPGISVFFPAYNDGGTIASMVLAALNTCRKLTDDYEVIVVNDGSTDYTGQVLDDIASRDEHVKIVTHKKNRGYGGALRTGFKTASKEWVFYTDGDAQYDAHELAMLAPAMRPEVDIVQGYKIARHDPIFRIVIGKTYHWIVKLMFGLRVRDTDCDFRLIRKSALERIDLKSNTGTICVELVKKLQDSGATFAEVPVHHYHRAYGRSQFFNFKRLWATGVHLLQLWVELVALPRLTGRKTVKSLKPAMQVDERNPSLVYYPVEAADSEYTGVRGQGSGIRNQKSEIRDSHSEIQDQSKIRVPSGRPKSKIAVPDAYSEVET